MHNRSRQQQVKLFTKTAILYKPKLCDYNSKMAVTVVYQSLHIIWVHSTFFHLHYYYCCCSCPLQAFPELFSCFCNVYSVTYTNCNLVVLYRVKLCRTCIGVITASMSSSFKVKRTSIMMCIKHSHMFNSALHRAEEVERYHMIVYVLSSFTIVRSIESWFVVM